MPRKPRATASGECDGLPFEQKLARAAKDGQLSGVEDAIADAVSHGPISPDLLTSVLLKSCEQGHADVARYLILQGARSTFASSGRVPPLLRAIGHGHVEIVELLISHGTDLDVRDKKGRTALMTAAWKNNASIVRLLLSKGSELHATDLEKRHVLHNLAADESCPTYDRVIEILLETHIDLEAKDRLGRTPLHWAAATGNIPLACVLLQRRRGSPSNIHACDSRTKAPIHLAAAHNHIQMVKFLLDRNADPRARSDGYWTPLHNACEKGSVELVQLLLEKGADINAQLLNGRTPLHVAAEAGNAPVALCLLKCSTLRRSIKDRFGDTPLLRAAQSAFAGRKDIIELLAPWNNVEALSDDALDACKEFTATMIDFGKYRNGNKVSRKSVHELLYARDRKDPRNHAVSTLPTNIKATDFRWIHLPANNIAWCDALLTKRFIEEGAVDVEGFKALERSFHHQHRGQQHHSYFMRPLCQVEPRGHFETEQKSQFFGSPKLVVSGPAQIVRDPDPLASMPEHSDLPAFTPSNTIESGLSHTEVHPSTAVSSGRKEDAAASSRTSHTRRKPVRRSTASSHSTSNRSHSTGGRGKPSSNNIYVFMPYLHFETNKRRNEMQRVIESMRDVKFRHPAVSQDEKLLRAHLSASSSVLHIRRTLDQFFYHNIDTKFRDDNQVVRKYQRLLGKGSAIDPKIVMVDQLWMWILGKDLVVTAFPQRWQQPRNDPLNVLECLIQDINSKTREPVENVFELAMLITGRCVGIFDRHKKGDDDFQLIDMFEASIGNVMNTESTLFHEFKIASRQASSWLKQNQRPTRLARNLDKAEKRLQDVEERLARNDAPVEDDRILEPHFVDHLLDIGQETDLLAEIKDIRDELMIMRLILENQEQVLPDLEHALQSAYKADHRSEAQLRKLQKSFDEHNKNIGNPKKDINRMDKQAERMYNSIISLLDLKQKHANAFEARFARDQAAGSARQGQTIMVFTIVTVIFLPLTFIAAFFTMNISNFPHNSSGAVEVSLSYVSTYVFGIGISISIPCVFVALSVDRIGNGFNESVRWLRQSWSRSKSRQESDVQRELGRLAMEKTLSLAKDKRRSVDNSWKDGTRSQVYSSDIEQGRDDLGFAARPNWDTRGG